jgi:hypothetical protein
VKTLALGLVAALAACSVSASHDWNGLDLCHTYRERMPPELAPSLFPEPESAGARLVAHYCGQCHYAPAPGHHTASQWPKVLERMDLLIEVTARFGRQLKPLETPSPVERALMGEYLAVHALRPLADPAVAPADYRTLCGDCHAVPDPAAYFDTDWPAVLARMTSHRQTMARPPARRSAQAKVERYLGLAPAATDPVTEAGNDEPPAPRSSGSHRWLAVGPFFLLALFGVARWWLNRPFRS